MVFSSPLFIFIYLTLTLLGYYVIPMLLRGRGERTIYALRGVWLFAVNLVFYAWGEPLYVFLMLASITVNYIFGLLIAEAANRRGKKYLLIACIAVNLGALGYYKYADLFLTTLGLPAMGLTLPIGISFYTFQTMSYPIDVYRGKVPAQRNYIKFGTFVALFPQLIAGPIVRYIDVAEQLDRREHSVSKFADGVTRFTVGLSKKVLLANNVGALWNWYGAQSADEISALGAWLGILAFTLQIYFDFSGYSDMAVGLGKMIGFDFPENFNYPYTANSVTDFWRRWHITLSSWFRDYVYIPLGGSRKGTARLMLNLLIVWCLTGFWHGASWNFLMWGLYYAVLLIAEKTFLLKALDRLPAIIARIYTIAVVMLGWALFAIEDFGALGSYLSAMLGAGAAIDGAALYWLRNYAVTLVISIAACTPLPKLAAAKLAGKLKSSAWSYLKPAAVLIALTLCTASLINSAYNPFLYFRF
ncbi:MAG: MBOAT family protein [Oscillospiraceae bacterium]|jgi:alginate O-acetyltransferase complex protein AlgI|nr:MBOAT family protein [Oscillospiraceae bacterium]